MQLFYNSQITQNTSQFTFDKIESRHIVRVLRKKEGDVIYITNGLGQLFSSKVLVANDKKCLVKISEVENHPKPWNYYLHIAIAPTKLNDRFEWFLEKATEIGIDEITPLLCQRSERKVLKDDRLEKIVITAMKQSVKAYKPKINSLTKYADFIKNDFEGSKLIAHCENNPKPSLKSKLNNANSFTILIGPEGDFSPDEIALAINNNFEPIHLGKSRLRTETAGIVACHTINIIKDE